MYFLRLNAISNNKKTFIFGEVEKIENHYVGIYEIYLKNGIGFYKNNIEHISLVNASDQNEVLPLEKASKILISYLFGEL